MHRSVERKSDVGAVHIGSPFFECMHVVAARALDIERGESAVGPGICSAIIEEMGSIGIDVDYRKFLQILGMRVSSEMRDPVVDFENSVVARALLKSISRCRRPPARDLFHRRSFPGPTESAESSCKSIRA